jgi:hypothetical protein
MPHSGTRRSLKLRKEQILFKVLQNAGAIAKNYFERNNKKLNFSFQKIAGRKENSYLNYSNRGQTINRIPDNDRMFPIENGILNEYKEKTNEEVNNAFLYMGDYADELTRSMNALALTVGYKIYFRNGAYRPESEEGRKTLAHELTHVKQFSKDLLAGQHEIKELEEEAVKTEQIAAYDPDPVLTIKESGLEFKMRKSKIPKLMAQLKNDIEDWVEHQKYIMEEEKYLRLLITYQEMEDRGEFIWQRSTDWKR